MKVFEDAEVYLQSFFTSTLDISEWSASFPGHFILGSRAEPTHCLGDWLDRMTSKGVLERNFLFSYRESKSVETDGTCVLYHGLQFKFQLSVKCMGIILN
jgi:hypothetical protein